MDSKKMRAKIKLYRILFIVCSVLSLVGLVIVLAAGGNSHLEFVMVPMVAAAIFSSLYQDAKKTLNEWEKK